MYEIRQVTNNAEWEEFLLRQLYTIFVQSPTYGEFFKAMGEDYFIFGVYKDNELIGGSLVLTTHAKRGHFLYLPYGPMLSFEDSRMLKQFFRALSEFARERGFDFIRVSPFVDDTHENCATFAHVGLRAAPMHIIAENTWILDVSSSADELLANMKKNHRNLIRRCMREGVDVKIKTDIEALQRFNRLHDETVKRHNFVRYSDKYINTEFAIFAKKNQVALFESYLPDGSHDATAFIIFYGNMAAYHHAASLGLNKKVPTSYLVQWEIIKEAKRRGMKWYNFWGIAPAESNKHPFQGVTHFKKGFGGFQKDLLHCQDLPLTNKYWLNWIVETVRRRKRGF